MRKVAELQSYRVYGTNFFLGVKKPELHSYRATELRDQFFLGVKKPELQSYKASTGSFNYKKATELQGYRATGNNFFFEKIYEKLQRYRATELRDPKKFSATKKT